MIDIYTDASVNDNYMVATCFIVTDDNFIGYTVTEKEGVDTSLEAELEGALSAVNYAIDCDKVQDATLHTDSISLIKLLSSNLLKSTNKQAVKYRERLILLQRLVSTYSIKLELIQGHAKQHNPNKVVDLISNSILRYHFSGGE